MEDTYSTAKYTEQMPFVGTKEHRKFINDEARKRRISRAQVIREALDLLMKEKAA